MTDRGTRKHHVAEGGGIPGCGSPPRPSRGRPAGTGEAPRASVRDRGFGRRARVDVQKLCCADSRQGPVQPGFPEPAQHKSERNIWRTT